MKEQDDLLIEQYIESTLTEKEKQDFEQRLQEDQALAAAYELRLSMDQFLEDKAKKEQFTQFIEGVSQDFFAERDSKKTTDAKVVSIWQRFPFVVASLAIAAAIALLLILPFLRPQDRYEQFNDHRALALVEMSIQNTAAAQEAQTAFNAGDYSTALDALNAYLTDRPEDVEAQLYKGISLLELNELQAARAIFEPIAEGTSAFQSEGLWYLALSYLKEEDAVNTKKYLERLITENKDQNLIDKAKRLQNELE
ncbi:MAG: tetratricopeptide repeat protein [Bacteroidota bacterium]